MEDVHQFLKDTSGGEINHDHFISQVVSLVPDIISVLEYPSKKIIYSNDDALERLGFDKFEINRMSFSERASLIHQDDLKALDTYFNLLGSATDKDIISVQYRAKNKAGGWLTFHARGRVFKRNVNGDVIQILNVLQNITAEKDSQQVVSDQSQFIKSVTDFSPAIVLIRNHPSGEIAFINRDIHEVLGFENSGIDGERSQVWHNLVHQDDAELLTEFYNQLAHVKNGDVKQMQFRFRDSKNNYVWYDAKGKVFKKDDKGNVVQTILIISDINEQKSNEQELFRIKDDIATRATDKYLTLLNHMEQGFCIIEVMFDEEGKAYDYRFLETNPVFTKQTGLKDVIGKSTLELVPDHEKYWFKIYGDVVKFQRPVHFENFAANLEVESRKRGIWYDVFAMPYGKPELNQAAIFFNDITEKKNRLLQAEFIAEITKEIVAVGNISEVFSKIGERICRYFNAKWCLFSEVTDGDRTGVVTNGWNSPDVMVLNGRYRMEDYLSGEVSNNCNKGIPTIVNDTQNDTRVSAEGYGAFNLHSFLIIPLARNDEFNFLLSIADSVAREWTNEEVEVLNEISVRIWARLERARAEDALRQSEERLRLAMQTAEIYWWEYDCLRNSTVYSTNAAEVLGKSPGTTFEDIIQLIHPDDREKSIEIFNEAIVSGKSSFSSTVRTIADPEMIRWIHVTGKINRDAQGNAVIVNGISQDVSERIEFEEALQKSSLRLERVLETDAVGVIFFNHDGKVVNANDVFLRMTGYTHQDIEKGMTWKDMTPPEFIEDSKIQMERFRVTGKVGPYEKEYFLADGSRRWMLFAGRDLGDGTIAEYCIDINERKKVEKELIISQKKLAQELKDSKQLQHISNRIIEENDIQTLFDEILDSAMELMHADFASLQKLLPSEDTLELIAWKNFHPEAAEHWKYIKDSGATSCGRALAAFDRMIVNDINNSQIQVDEKDLDAFRKSGIIAMQSTPLINRDGKCIGMISTHWNREYYPSEHEFNLFDVLARQVTDLIQQRLSEDALRQSEAQLRYFNQSLENIVEDRTIELKRSQNDLVASNDQLRYTISQLESFNYIASHDLKEPLRKIQTFAGLLEEQQLENSSLTTYLQGIRNAAARMSMLIDDLLAYSKLNSKDDVFQITDLNKVLQNVLTDFDLKLHELNARVDHDILPSVPAIPFQIHQLFANLIGNSLKFTDKAPLIRILCNTISGLDRKDSNAISDRRYVRIEFIDNGIGFDDEYNERIFQVFQRLHTQGKYPGTGIGLSIVDKVVKNHNGFITARGKKGEGAVFTVFLPTEQ